MRNNIRKFSKYFGFYSNKVVTIRHKQDKYKRTNNKTPMKRKFNDTEFCENKRARSDRTNKRKFIPGERSQQEIETLRRTSGEGEPTS